MKQKTSLFSQSGDSSAQWPVSFIGLLAFVEGSAVVSFELLAGRYLTPWFGTSLYVWSSVIGVTLTALLVGYFLGGRAVSKQIDPLNAVGVLLMCTSLWLMALPFISNILIINLLDIGLVLGLLCCLCIFLIPGLILLGMVPSMLIGSTTGNVKLAAGSISGLVFALSTIGGIATSFLLGLLLIPRYGASWPAIFLGVGFGLPGVMLLLPLGKQRLAFLWLVVASSLGILGAGLPTVDRSVLYYNEGLMGQIKVVDLPEDPQGRKLRALVVNNIMQTIIDPNDPTYAYWPYARLVSTIAASYPKGSRTLLLGAGGGAIAHLLERQGCTQTLVEIDDRLVEVARKWFSLSTNLKVQIDDARHVLRTSKSSYDIIICDAFRGESAPEHLLTLEGFTEMGAILNPKGVILVNFYGYTHGPAGDLVWSVVKTAKAAGFETQVVATSGPPDQRNLLIRIWDPAFHQDRPKVWVDASGEDLGFELAENSPERSGVLTDDQPQSLLFSAASMQWRRLYNQYFRSIVQDPSPIGD